MRIVKSAHGFSIVAASTVRVTFFTWKGIPSARLYWHEDVRYPDILQTSDPRGIWYAAYRAARHLARYQYKE